MLVFLVGTLNLAQTSANNPFAILPSITSLSILFVSCWNTQSFPQVWLTDSLGVSLISLSFWIWAPCSSHQVLSPTWYNLIGPGSVSAIGRSAVGGQQVKFREKILISLVSSTDQSCILQSSLTSKNVEIFISKIYFSVGSDPRR